MSKTDLIVIGGGAAGLMAGCAAGELGLKTVVLERKHKPGRKLLMCGNARCNLTTNISMERMVEMFGEPVGSFLEPALRAFSPSMLQRWFAANGLKTVVKAGNKVYPHTECAADVLNLFTDLLRDRNVTLACSAVVESIETVPSGFRVTTDNFVLDGARVLVATGGVSYPKTGSVGDGLRWARQWGLCVEPERPGLAGFEGEPSVLKGRIGKVYGKVEVDVLAAGRVMGRTRGVYEIEKWGIGGTAVTDASRIVSRLNLRDYLLRIKIGENQTEEVRPLRPRPLKEAMVTVGGVSLGEIDPRTMESRKIPGLYFAGEVLDVDGPTGGYNLQAAFSTARLAVAAIGKHCGKGAYALPDAGARGETSRDHGRRERNRPAEGTRRRRKYGG